MRLALFSCAYIRDLRQVDERSISHGTLLSAHALPIYLTGTKQYLRIDHITAAGQLHLPNSQRCAWPFLHEQLIAVQRWLVKDSASGPLGSLPFE